MAITLQLSPNLGPDGKAGTDDDFLALSYVSSPPATVTLVWQVLSGSPTSPTVTTLAGLPTASGSNVTRSTLNSMLSSVSQPFALRVVADDDTNLNTDLSDQTSPTELTVDVFSPTNVGGTFTESGDSVLTLKFDELVTIDGVTATALTEPLRSAFSAALKIVLNPSQEGGADMPSGVAVNIKAITGFGTDTLSITTDQAFAATDVIRVAYPNPGNASGRLTDMSGNALSYQQLWVGGSGATAVDLGDYFADRAIYVRGNGGDDSLTGGQGNDVLLDGPGGDVLNGGRGSDVVVLVETGLSATQTSTGTYARDTILIEPGQSVTGLSGALRDVIQPSATAPTTSGFDIVSAVVNLHDVLSLPSGKIADNTTTQVDGTTFFDGTDYLGGSGITFSKHSIANGVVTFKDSAGSPIALNSPQKGSDAVTYLAKNWGAIPAGNTVAVAYDRDANGSVDSLLIYQQGGKVTAGLPSASPYYLPANHLYIKDLVGASTAVLGNSPGAGVVQIIDTQVPNPINIGLLSDTQGNSTGVGIDFAELINVAGTGGLVIKQNGVTALTFTLGGASSSLSPTAVFTTPLIASDWVLLTLGGVDEANYIADLAPQPNKVPAAGGDPSWGGLVLGSASANTIDLSDTIRFDPMKEYDLSAAGGDDAILGSSGNVRIEAGQGADTMSGGGGQDEFEFVQGDSPSVSVELADGAPSRFTFSAGADVVTDLSAGEQVRLMLPFQDLRSLGGLTPMGTDLYAYSGAMPSTGLVSDQAFFVVRGTYAPTNGGAFTVDISGGADTLIVYDGNTASAAFSNTGLVLKGVTPSELSVYSGGVVRNVAAVTPGTDNAPAFGNPALTWDANNTPLDSRDDKLIVSVTDDDNDGSAGKTLAFTVRPITDGYTPVQGNITNGTSSTNERVDFTLQPRSDGTFYTLSLFGGTASSVGTGGGASNGSTMIELNSTRFYGASAPTAAQIVASLAQDSDYATAPITLTANGSVITASFKQTGDVLSSVMFYEHEPILGAPLAAPTLVATATETQAGSAATPEIQTLTLSASLVPNGTYALKLGSYGQAIVAQPLDATPTAAELAAALNAAATEKFQPIQVNASGSNLTINWNSPSAYDLSDLAKLFTLTPLAPFSGVLSAATLQSGLDFAGVTSPSAIRVTATETYGIPIQSSFADVGLPPLIIQSVEVSGSPGHTALAEGVQITYLVRLNAPAPAGGYQFDWRLAPADGTSMTGGATAADFVVASGKVSVIAGATTASFTVTVADDTESEYSEYFGIQVGTFLDGVFTRLHAYDASASIQESDQGGSNPPPGDSTTLTGTAGPDTLTAPSGTDAIVLGLDGNDSADGLDEGDIFIGGSGNDLAKFAGNASDYIVQKASQGQLDTLGQLVPGGVPSGQDVFAIQHKVGATSWAFVQAEQVQFGTESPVDPLTLLSGGGGGGGGGGELIVNSSQSGAYASISAAISAATAGATILVAAGHIETSANTPIWVSKDNLHIVFKATNLPVLTFQLEEVDTIHNLYLFGGTGANIVGNSTDNILLGTQGNDTIDGRGGNDKLMGTDGADQLTGGAGNDWLDGGSGWDMLLGGFGDDMLMADEGGLADTVSGGQADLLVGGSGNDLLMAGESGSAASKIRMLGGSGSDTFRVVNLNGAGSNTSDPAVADAIKLNAYIADLSGADGLDLSALRASFSASQPISPPAGTVVAGDWSASLAALYATGVQGVLDANAVPGSTRPFAPIDQVEAGSSLGIGMVNDAAVAAAMARTTGAPSTQSIIDSMMPVYGPLEQFNHQYFS